LKISKIILYDEPSVPELKIERLRLFIKNTFGVNVEIKKNIFNFLGEESIAKIASCRIFKMTKPFQRHNPTIEEIDFEKQASQDSSKIENIVMYDGFEIQKIISKSVSHNADELHIAFTNKLTCTYDYSDYRYHGRTVICSNPSIISTTGIIEAPAKPREYYMELSMNITQGLNPESVKKKFQGTYLEYHDPRLSEITEGYILQAVFYYLTGESFCDSLDCRLNNAHWQKDLLHSQLEIGKLCEKHQTILNNLVNNLN